MEIQYTKEYLSDLYNKSIELNSKQLMAKLSVESRGLPYYGNLKKVFPIHFKRFKSMNHRRGKVNLEFRNSVEGFINFIVEIGPIPEGMVFPSVGRKDHSKGYEVGNFRWQEFSENCSDRTGVDDPHKKLIENNKSGKLKGRKWYNDGKNSYLLNSNDPRIPNLSKGQIMSPTKIITCPHCGKTGGNRAMKQWHFNNCKSIKP